MPELPEVETVRRVLAAADLRESRIKGVVVGWEPTVGGAADRFEKLLVGRTIADFQRRGKYLLIQLNDRLTLVCHLRMSGMFKVAETEEPKGGYERAIIQLENGREIRFHDPRKFGRIIATTDPDSVMPKLAPEPLSDELTVAYVTEQLKRRHRQLKPMLLDQTALVAGLGNIYVDEALWQARLHPCQLSDTVTRPKARLLQQAIQDVIRRGIQNSGTSLGKGSTNFILPGHNRQATNQEQLKVYGRTKQPCDRHPNATIRRLIVGQRSTHICPRCQRLSN